MRRMYSEEQLKKLVSKSPEAVVAALQNQDLKVKTIFQSEPLWELDLGSILETDLVAEGSTLYSKLALCGNVLWLIISGTFVNGTNEGSNIQIILNKDINIPDEIASKIYRADGTTLDKNNSGVGEYRSWICGEVGIRSTNNLSSLSCMLESPLAKRITLTLYGLGTHTQGNEYFIDIRIPILIK